MTFVEVTWLEESPSLKELLQETLHCSGQLLKRHFSSRELNQAIPARSSSRLPLDLVNHLLINPLYAGPAVKILQETAEYIALHKPGFIHSHPLCYSDQDTVLNALAAMGKWEALKVNEKSYDRGLFYRLDYETSGVIVLAKQNELYEKIRGSFSTLVKQKFYWAIVEGDFDREGKWTHYFLPSGVKGSKQKVGDFPKGDSVAATLEVRTILKEKGRSLVLVDLKTGVRHQIRAQLAHLGFPILGDELYGGRKEKRLFLHALMYDWGERVLDPNADLFEGFFDLDRALKMSHDVIRILQGH